MCLFLYLKESHLHKSKVIFEKFLNLLTKRTPEKMITGKILRTWGSWKAKGQVVTAFETDQRKEDHTTTTPTITTKAGKGSEDRHHQKQKQEKTN